MACNERKRQNMSDGDLAMNELQHTHGANDEAKSRWLAEIQKKPSFVDIIAAASGLFSGGKKEASLSAGRIVQAAMSGKAKQQLFTEYEQFKEAGKIKDDYEKSDQGWNCFHATLRAMEEATGTEQLDAIREVFLGIATENVTTCDSLAAYEMLKTVASLDALSIVMLRTIWNGLKNHEPYFGDTEQEAIATIMHNCGVPKEYKFLLVEPIKRLCEHYIIHTTDINNVAGALVKRDHKILTSFGRDICNLLEEGHQPDKTTE